MIIKPADVHDDIGKARLGVGLACEALDIQCNLRRTRCGTCRSTATNSYPSLELARECAENPA